MTTKLEMPDDMAPYVRDALQRAADKWRLQASSGYRYGDRPETYDMSPHYAVDRRIAASLEELADKIAQQGEAALMALIEAHNAES